MIDIPVEGATRESPRLKPVERSSLLPWQKVVLATILFSATFIDFYQLGLKSFGSPFYAAGVRSMGDSLHNFFFVSYDPGGFITIDKPPLGFWLQVLSTKAFGFTPFSLFLPQALAGVFSVYILFRLVRRPFGVNAGLLAALALAFSPINAVTNRNNTIDSTLVLVLLLATWAIIYATETGKWRWLLLSTTLVGLGFNIKTLEAYLVVPAFVLLYLIATPQTLKTRVIHLSVALLVMIVISLSWITIVDLTPASQRPYVGSSQTNSELNLAIGYNGAARIVGGTAHAKGASGSQSSFDLNEFVASNAEKAEVLFNENRGGQISWLLPAALLALLALAWQGRPHWQENRQQQALILWGAWLLVMGAVFSVAATIHAYYMVTLAPAICALFGIGIVVMWRDYRRGSWRGLLLPLTLGLTAAEQISLIRQQPAWGLWLIGVIAIGCMITILALIINTLIQMFRPHPDLPLALLSIGLIALLLTPAIWSIEPALGNIVHNQPSAGPVGQGGSGFQFNPGSVSTNQPFTINTLLLHYLETHQGTTKFLVAVASSTPADTLILASNKPVMNLGGFSGRDSVLSLNQLKSLIVNGTVRFFLLSNNPHPTVANNNLINWVKKTCPVTPPHKKGSLNLHLGNSRLYDCLGKG
jgi:4-amino-4-deoxy-L-arabinose transferase-like glycosyltransferase